MIRFHPIKNCRISAAVLISALATAAHIGCCIGPVATSLLLSTGSSFFFHDFSKGLFYLQSAFLLFFAAKAAQAFRGRRTLPGIGYLGSCVIALAGLFVRPAPPDEIRTQMLHTLGNLQYQQVLHLRLTPTPRLPELRQQLTDLEGLRAASVRQQGQIFILPYHSGRTSRQHIRDHLKRKGYVTEEVNE